MENQSGPRLLPILIIEGTDFYVDTVLNEFREKDAPWNRIPMDEMMVSSEGGITGLVYDRNTKNRYQEIVDPDHIPEHVTLIIIPPLTELDPVGLARRYGMDDNTFQKQKAVNAVQEKRPNKRRGRHL